MSINRYESTKKTELNKFKTTRYPKFKRSSTDIFIITRELDRLDLLATEYYQDPRYWWIIAEANNLGKGTFHVPAGMQIRIPFPITNLSVELRDTEDNR